MCHVLDALRLRNLRDCLIYSGPIRGSVYVEACHNCTIMVACRQLRVHGSSGIDFYVHTLSGPIIEGCTATRFAPYRLSYPGLQQHMAEAALILPQRSATQTYLPTPETRAADSAAGTASALPIVEPWRDVKDFLWHRSRQSPNWCIMPDEDRVKSVAVEGHAEITLADFGAQEQQGGARVDSSDATA
ncbi:tubulin binding cofactor C-domain-containing protein [Tribonema minus]|uniref:Tubulin binding cofactor C-domain-containing protein n=1 Tax=Tribonema minus TaxID=303371 RepID=A0A835ZAT0_9STRA|nr:tubulin binding cofactor C-domain-containing protein [Tribonema minus]